METGVAPPNRFGVLKTTDGKVTAFEEKPDGAAGLINGGFFVLSPKIGDYLKDDTTVFERDPLEGLARDGQLGLFMHSGFWHPMDTLRDKVLLESLWNSGSAPWKLW